MRSVLALALLVAGCAAGGAPRHVSTLMYPLRSTLFVASFADWQSSPWYRPSDQSLTGPVYVLLAEGDLACVVSGQTWVRMDKGQWHECLTGWRTPRLGKSRATIGS